MAVMFVCDPTWRLAQMLLGQQTGKDVCQKRGFELTGDHLEYLTLKSSKRKTSPFGSRAGQSEKG